MFKYVFSLLIVSGLLSTWTDLFAKPDLIPNISIPSLAVKMPTGEYYVPVRVSVRNGGDDTAGRFKIHLEWSHSSFSGTKLAQLKSFSAADSAYTLEHSLYVWATRAFFVGNNFRFHASVVVPKNIPGKTKVYVRAVIDSCSGEEFMPVFCRIDESREDNNTTVLVSTTLPL